MLNGCLSQAAKPGLQWFFLLRVPFLSLIVRHTLGASSSDVARVRKVKGTQSQKSQKPDREPKSKVPDSMGEPGRARGMSEAEWDRLD